MTFRVAPTCHFVRGTRADQKSAPRRNASAAVQYLKSAAPGGYTHGFGAGLGNPNARGFLERSGMGRLTSTPVPGSSSHTETELLPPALAVFTEPFAFATVSSSWISIEWNF